MPEFVGVVEVRQVGELIGVGQGTDDFLVDPVADVGLAFERRHVPEARSFGDRDGGVGEVGVFVADVLEEEQDEHVVLVLAGVPAAAPVVAQGPDLALEFGFFPGHYLRDCCSVERFIFSYGAWESTKKEGNR